MSWQEGAQELGCMNAPTRDSLGMYENEPSGKTLLSVMKGAFAS